MASEAADVPDLSLADQGHRRMAWAPQEQRLLLGRLALLVLSIVSRGNQPQNAPKVLIGYLV
jgi:hypothetical protein